MTGCELNKQQFRIITKIKGSYKLGLPEHQRKERLQNLASEAKRQAMG
jgi:hypothetical protein